MGDIEELMFLIKDSPMERYEKLLCNCLIVKCSQLYDFVTITSQKKLLNYYITLFALLLITSLIIVWIR